MIPESNDIIIQHHYDVSTKETISFKEGSGLMTIFNFLSTSRSGNGWNEK